jgi:TRAP-type C4-dicarboxylate transport system substrate-binding protein
MKRLLFRKEVVISVALSLMLVFCLGNAKNSEAADVINLTFQGKWEGHEKENWAAEQLKLKDYVAQATDGKIQIKNMGEVVKDNEVIDGVRQAVVDLGCQPLFLRRELIAVNFLALPFVPHKEMPEIMNKLKPVYEDIWAKAGVKQLGYVYFLPQNLYTKKPCDTFEALKGMKLRINGRTLTTLFKDAGATPVAMTNAEVYTSLQRGLIDGAQTALPAYISGALYESCKYLSAWPLGGAGMGVIMNMDSWNKLGPELQKQFMSAFQQMEKAQFEGVYKDIGAVEAKAKELGGTRMDPPQGEKDKLLAFVGAVLEDWKEKAGPTADPVLKAINDTLGTNYK